MSSAMSLRGLKPLAPLGIKASFFLIFLFLGIYSLVLIFYRIWFSPIAKFPGPRVAAITGWYEGYFDIVKRGTYLYEIEKMHNKYGQIHCIV